MLSYFASLLAKAVETPHAPRYTSADEIVQQVRNAGGKLDTDSFHDSEIELVHEAVELGKLKFKCGSWADPDWLLIP